MPSTKQLEYLLNLLLQEYSLEFVKEAEKLSWKNNEDMNEFTALAMMCIMENYLDVKDLEKNKTDVEQIKKAKENVITKEFIIAEVKRLDPNLPESDEGFKVACILLAGIVKGADTKKIADFLQINEEDVKKYEKNLRESHVWNGECTSADWFNKEHGAVNFWLDVSVAEGYIKREPERRKEEKCQKLLKTKRKKSSMKKTKKTKRKRKKKLR